MSEPVEPLLPSEQATAVVAAGHAVDAVLFTRILEAALLTAEEPLSIAELKRLSDAPLETKYVEELLLQLAQKYSDSGVELNRVSSGWRFRARPEMQQHLDRLNPQKPPRYSRAVMETLAIIAYRQPVTRGDIEDIRGVAVSTQVLKTLEARGWIESIGTRDTPGKPALYATTPQFMDDLNLRSLSELPALEEMGSLLDVGMQEEQAQDEPQMLEAGTAESGPAESAPETSAA